MSYRRSLLWVIVGLLAAGSFCPAGAMWGGACGVSMRQGRRRRMEDRVFCYPQLATVNNQACRSLLVHLPIHRKGRTALESLVTVALYNTLYCGTAELLN